MRRRLHNWFGWYNHRVSHKDTLFNARGGYWYMPVDSICLDCGKRVAPWDGVERRR